MRAAFASLAVAWAVSASSDAPRILQPLEPIEHLSIACGCAFHAAEPGQPFYSGPNLLVLDPNGELPNARVNLGQGNIKLRPVTPVEFPLYACEAGALWTSLWHSDEVQIQADLQALKTGEESCWFEGSVTASIGNRSELASINGACGC